MCSFFIFYVVLSPELGNEEDVFGMPSVPPHNLQSKVSVFCALTAFREIACREAIIYRCCIYAPKNKTTNLVYRNALY